MADLRQTPEYADYLRSIGWQVEKIKNNYIFIIKLSFLGSVIKIQRSNKLLTINNLQLTIKKYRCFYISVEPSDEKQRKELLDNGFRKSKNPSLPTKTIQLNLSISEEMLLKSMHHKTRYNIGLAKRKGVEIILSKNIKMFSELWQESAKKRGMFLSQKKEIENIHKTFNNNAQIFFAKHKDDIVGGILLITTKDRAYYMYAFSTELGKRMHAPSLVAWESIRYAKKKGKKIYDFEGIYDERYPLKTWKGFTKFKSTFGGSVIKYPGPVSKWVNPLF